MHFFSSVAHRSSLASRFLLLKRLQSTQASPASAKSLFSYGKGGHFFSDRIDPSESVRISPNSERSIDGFRNSPKFSLPIEEKSLVELFEHAKQWV